MTNPTDHEELTDERWLRESLQGLARVELPAGLSPNTLRWRARFASEPDPALLLARIVDGARTAAGGVLIAVMALGVTALAGSDGGAIENLINSLPGGLLHGVAAAWLWALVGVAASTWMIVRSGVRLWPSA